MYCKGRSSLFVEAKAAASPKITSTRVYLSGNGDAPGVVLAPRRDSCGMGEGYRGVWLKKLTKKKKDKKEIIKMVKNKKGDCALV